MHEAGLDISFLVRPQRGKELAQSGLVIVSARPTTLRDVKTIEADHIIGDLIDCTRVQGKKLIDVRVLRVVYTHLKAYEARRERELQ